MLQALSKGSVKKFIARYNAVFGLRYYNNFIELLLNYYSKLVENGVE